MLPPVRIATSNAFLHVQAPEVDRARTIPADKPQPTPPHKTCSAGRLLNSLDGTVDYTNDDASQLPGADYDYQDDESYVYDENGNRVTANGDTYVTGDNNQLLSDGTYRYLYDDEGNRTLRIIDNPSQGTQGELDEYDTDLTEYTWDYRNRLTAVEHYDTHANYSAGTSDQSVEYAYDCQNRLIHKTLDPDGTLSGSGPIEQTTFVHGGNQITLQFDKTGTGDAVTADLSHRYLWGAVVDQILADEQVEDLQTAGEVRWALTDHLNTVRDLASYDAQNDETTIENHRTFDAYGNVTDETNAAVDCVFGFTGRLYDDATGLQNNLNRWYDSAIGRWMSEDTIGFEAGDGNLYRYVWNSPTSIADPSGTGPVIPAPPGSPSGFPYNPYPPPYYPTPCPPRCTTHTGSCSCYVAIPGNPTRGPMQYYVTGSCFIPGLGFVTAGTWVTVPPGAKGKVVSGTITATWTTCN